MMWSDPTTDVDNWTMSPRGAGWLFGENVTSQFNQINGLDLVARAHQLVMDGFEYWFKDSSLVSVWSAPNYCFTCKNDAAYLKISENLERTFEVYKEVERQMGKATNFRKTLIPYFL